MMRIAALILVLWAAMGGPARADSLTDGIAALQRGDHTAAEQLLKEYSADHPLDPVPYEWLAKVYEQAMNPQGMQTAMAQAKRLQQRQEAKAHPRPKPTASAAVRSRPAASIRLDDSSMASERSDGIEETADIQRLLDTGVDAAEAAAPKTDAERRSRISALQSHLGKLQSALSQLQSKIRLFSAPPQKVLEAAHKLEDQIKKQSEVVRDLKSELGESPDGD